MSPGINVRSAVLLLLILPRYVLGDCLSLVKARAGPACSPQASEILHLDRQNAGEKTERRGSNIDRLIDDPAFRAGAWVTGAATFRLRADAERLVGVFLMMPREVSYPVVLEVDGKAADTRYRTQPGPGRMRPRSGLEEITLLARVQPGATFIVRAAAPRYVVSAVRTTPLDYRLSPECEVLSIRRPSSPAGEASGVVPPGSVQRSHHHSPAVPRRALRSPASLRR